MIKSSYYYDIKIIKIFDLKNFLINYFNDKP